MSMTWQALTHPVGYPTIVGHLAEAAAPTLKEAVGFAAESGAI
jgi:hypothetical protein